MQPVFLYNTLARAKEEFTPLKSNEVTLYTCGPTVYNYAHIGNLRSYIFADILKRTLEYAGYNLKQVMNITDVGHLTSDEDSGEDKLDKQAKESGMDIWQIARFYEEQFFKDAKALNIKDASITCRATEHIDDMIELVKRLIANGHAYETEEAVYFEVSTFPRYTELSHQNLEDKITAAREEVNLDPQKRNPVDFALWFKAVGRFKNHIMRWESPWGEGFPGWHIECSAMSMKYLGDTLDIHSGGEDHIWVHHPNEIAQSECATGKKFVRFWLHGAFLVVGRATDEEKRMGKSEGNFLKVQTLIDNGYDPLAYRFLCFSAHYRTKLKFNWETLDGAVSGYNHIKEFAARAKQIGGVEADWVNEYRTRFASAIYDDLNMPQAMAVVADLIREADRLKDYGVLDALYDFDRVLGLNLKESVEAATSADDVVESLINERNEARKEKNWARADEIRKLLSSKGITLEDTSTGTLWRKA